MLLLRVRALSHATLGDTRMHVRYMHVSMHVRYACMEVYACEIYAYARSCALLAFLKVLGGGHVLFFL